jgi:hypothetical protein
LLGAGPRGVRSRTIHQSSISGCYPSLDYLLARRSYPRRASSLFTRRLGTGCPAPCVWAKSWSPPTPANRLPVAVAVPWSRRTGTLAWTRAPANRHPDRAPPPARWRRSPQIPRRTGEPARPEGGPGQKPAASPRATRTPPGANASRILACSASAAPLHPRTPSGVVVAGWVAPPADSNRRIVLFTGSAAPPSR